MKRRKALEQRSEVRSASSQMDKLERREGAGDDIGAKLTQLAAVKSNEYFFANAQSPPTLATHESHSKSPPPIPCDCG